MLLGACSASSPVEAIALEAMPIAAELLCDVLLTNPSMLHELLLQWEAGLPSMLQKLADRSATVETSQIHIEALHGLLRSLEESAKGKQLMRAHAAQLTTMASHFSTTVGHVASAATQAAKLEAQVRYVISH